MTSQQLPSWFQKWLISILLAITGVFLSGLYIRINETAERVTSLEKAVAVQSEQYTAMLDGQRRVEEGQKRLEAIFMRFATERSMTQ